eukprot:CAMPEP_0181510062 /NCGR_PEP_ID=MMETSP1110-20121109/60681_1 /TAXON_ID=174948 /ORGANISM="Symbiodinium sp., Strain CCMP421" /LENGTH=65 /DNA_ID=CAMNT_0023639669 /DNA_START=19 /DNA_END=213 /DNA_ORIENTATION=+
MRIRFAEALGGSKGPGGASAAQALGAGQAAAAAAGTAVQGPALADFSARSAWVATRRDEVHVTRR